MKKCKYLILSIALLVACLTGAIIHMAIFDRAILWNLPVEIVFITITSLGIISSGVLCTWALKKSI